MRSHEDRERVRSLLDAGLNDCAIARRTGLPRTTIRDWRAARYVRGAAPRSACPICGSQTPSQLPAAYAYLLGLYLGDGHIARAGRTMRLRIFLDDAYPDIIASAREAVLTVLPTSRAGLVRCVGCTAVSSYSKHWPCLFPQHGAGPKHQRPIVLTDWQGHLAAAHPHELVRGLIHSDGCRFVNKVRAGGRRYEYPRYLFTNLSEDIRRIFCEACDAIGVEWRVMNPKTISVARRDSVAKLDTFVGPKR